MTDSSALESLIPGTLVCTLPEHHHNVLGIVTGCAAEPGKALQAMRREAYLCSPPDPPPLKKTPEPEPKPSGRRLPGVSARTTVEPVPVPERTKLTARPRPRPGAVGAGESGPRPAGWEYMVVDVRLAAGTLGDGTPGWVAYGTLMRKPRWTP